MDRAQPPVGTLVGRGRDSSNSAAQVTHDLQGSVCSQVRREHIQPFGSVAFLIGRFEHLLID